MLDAMPLEQMKTYQGRQEVLEDFDQFWATEKAQCSEIPTYQLVKKDFSFQHADFYDLTFEGTNDSQVYAKCIFPKLEKFPVLFYFHGYQGQSPDWTENLKYVAAGFGVVCMDVRGQAGHSNDFGRFTGMTVKGQIIRGALDGKEHLFYKDVYLDVYQLIEVVASLEGVDDSQLFSYGASQGGALALVAAALSPRITKTVSIYPFLSDFKRVLEFGNHSEAYDELFRYFKFSDPFHKTEDAFLQVLSYIDVKNLAHLISCPVYMMICLEDVVCPPSTQFAIFNRLTCHKNLQIVPDYGHDPLHVQVNDWVFDALFDTTIL